MGSPRAARREVALAGRAFLRKTAASAMAAPKLKPTTTMGRLYSVRSQSSAASTSADSAWPSCRPSLRPVPRKLKRRTGQPRPHSGAFKDLHGVVDDFVVHGAAAQRMRMADERGKAANRARLRSAAPPSRPAGPCKSTAAQGGSFRTVSEPAKEDGGGHSKGYFTPACASCHRSPDGANFGESDASRFPSVDSASAHARPGRIRASG